MNWLLKLLFAAIGQMCTGAVQVLNPIINNVFDTMYQINVNLKIDDLNKYTVTFALSLVGVLTIKQMLFVYGTETDGDPESDPLEAITRVAICVTTIVCGSYLINYGVKMASVIAKEVTAKISSTPKTFDEMFSASLDNILVGSTANMFVLLIILVITLIAFVVFIFKAAKRGAELVLIGILLPIMACDLLTTNRERWNAFATEAMIIIFGYILQLICYCTFMIFFAKIGEKLDIKYMIASLAWLMLVLSAPKWLAKFVYKSGVGDTVKGGARTATMMVPQLLSRLR